MHFKRLHELGDALAAEGYSPVHFGPGITLFQRTTGACAIQ
jgi:hypothetical protein